MSGETESNVSGWTTDTALQFVLQRIEDRDRLLDERYETQTKALDAAFVAAEKAVSAALQSAKEAVTKAEAASAERFASVNEFRGQLADQAATLVTRTEIAAKMDGFAEKLSDLSTRVERIETARLTGTQRGVEGRSVATLVLGVIAALAIIASLILAFQGG